MSNEKRRFCKGEIVYNAYNQQLYVVVGIAVSGLYQLRNLLNLEVGMSEDRGTNLEPCEQPAPKFTAIAASILKGYED